MDSAEYDDTTPRLHGDWGEYGAHRWCAECEEWVETLDWMEHRDHGDYRLEVDDVE